MFVRLRFQAATLRLNKPLRQFSSIANADVKPIEIKLKKQEKALYIKFNDNCSFRYPAEYLRVESPSAEVQGHGTTQGKRIIAGRRYIGIIGIEPVGSYAIRLMFDDLHESGIYSWSYLYELGVNKYQIMRKYIKALKASGKSRDPRAKTSTK